jgi:choline dehydrogenase-like flavoprotein
MAWHLPVLPER